MCHPTSPIQHRALSVDHQSPVVEGESLLSTIHAQGAVVGYERACVS